MTQCDNNLSHFVFLFYGLDLICNLKTLYFIFRAILFSSTIKFINLFFFYYSHCVGLINFLHAEYFLFKKLFFSLILLFELIFYRSLYIYLKVILLILMHGIYLFFHFLIYALHRLYRLRNCCIIARTSIIEKIIRAHRAEHFCSIEIISWTLYKIARDLHRAKSSNCIHSVIPALKRRISSDRSSRSARVK